MSPSENLVENFADVEDTQNPSQRATLAEEPAGPVNLGAIEERLRRHAVDFYSSVGTAPLTIINSGSELQPERPREVLIYRPKQKVRNEALRVLQEWEGIVLTVSESPGGSEDFFVAELHDLTNQNEAESAEFSLDEVYIDQRNLVKPGAPFHWIIGYRDRNGTRERVSQIVFRRLPAWREEDIDEAREEARVLAESIRFE